MANHVNRQLREAVATALTGLTTTGSDVFQSRVYPLAEADLPGLRIFCGDEQLEVATIHSPALYQRTVEVIVEGCARAVSDVDDTLDAIRKEVEIALAAGVTVGSHTVPLTLTAVATELDDSTEQPMGVARMSFSATIFTLATTPDVVSGA